MPSRESAAPSLRSCAWDRLVNQTENVMVETMSVTFRCAALEVARADALAPELAKRAEFKAAGRGGEVSRSTVLRYALTRGLDVLEAEAARGGA